MPQCWGESRKDEEDEGVVLSSRTCLGYCSPAMPMLEFSRNAYCC